jgi:hypothetical protein
VIAVVRSVRPPQRGSDRRAVLESLDGPAGDPAVFVSGFG